MPTQSLTLQRRSRLALATAVLGLAWLAVPHPADAAGDGPHPAATPRTASTDSPAPQARKGTGATAHHAKVPRRQRGKASIYARMFNHRKMADGNRMDPAAPNAASKTLPLGTVAEVTNLENGRSTQVTIQDRGPYVKGRVVDLSPASAREIGLDLKQGVAPVEVKPVAVPGPDGELQPVRQDG